MSSTGTMALPKYRQGRYTVLSERHHIVGLHERSWHNANYSEPNLLLSQDPDSPSYWMDMLKVMSETLRIGMVVSDMFVPGCPLAYLNEGFAAQTGTSASERMHEHHPISLKVCINRLLLYVSSGVCQSLERSVTQTYAIEFSFPSIYLRAASVS